MMKQTLVMSGVIGFESTKYLIVFLSTILIYQFATAGIIFPFKLGLFFRNKMWVSLMLVLLITLLFLLSTLSFNEQVLLFFISMCCFGYIISIGRWKGLRAIPAIKGSLLALVWAMVTVLFPLINQWNWNAYFILLLQRFLFMLGICIVYNLRDVDTDRKQGIVTIAALAGEKKTKLIAGFCLLLFVLSVLFYKDQFQVALLLSAIITAIAISKAKINGNKFYYQYIIDGCMTLQSLMVILFAQKI